MADLLGAGLEYARLCHDSVRLRPNLLRGHNYKCQYTINGRTVSLWGGPAIKSMPAELAQATLLGSATI